MAKLNTASASPAANMPLTKKGKAIMKNMVAESFLSICFY